LDIEHALLLSIAAVQDTKGLHMTAAQSARLWKETRLEIRLLNLEDLEMDSRNAEFVYQDFTLKDSTLTEFLIITLLQPLVDIFSSTAETSTSDGECPRRTGTSIITILAQIST
jgi:hypothetical protein